MATESYEQALTSLLKDEGGYTDHPSDPGGPTNFGITLADARRYWNGNATADDVRTMPQTVARKIYRERYWDALRCDDLPAGVDYAVFDYGVNSGVGRAGKVLRRALKLTDRSSAVSDDVVAAANAAPAPDLIELICMERIAFLRGLKTWPVFGRGWARRVAGVRAAALTMAAEASLASSSASGEVIAVGKAVQPSVVTAPRVGAGAVIAAGAAVAASHAPSLPVVLGILVFAGIVAGVVAVAALAVRRWRQRRIAGADTSVIAPHT